MPWRTDLLDPIPGANPSGADLRYDPVYEKVKEARREDDRDVFGGAPKVADWAQVVKIAGDALATKTKDLQLAAWLTEAMLKREGCSGLRGGLELIHYYLTNYWDTVYPQIEDGDLELRAAPLSWLGLKLDIAVKQAPLNHAGHDYLQYQAALTLGYEEACEGDYYKLEARKEAIEKFGRLAPEEFDKSFAETPKSFYKQLTADIDASLAALDALSQIGDEKFGDAAPSYTNLRKALEEVQLSARQLLKKKLEVDPDPVEPEQPETPTASGSEYIVESVGVGGGAAVGAVRVMTAEPSSEDDAKARIAAAAKYLRRAQPSNPAPYLLLRGWRWGEVRAARTPDPKLLEAPPTETRTQLKRFLLDAKWPELLEACENAMALPCGRGWLDLQRYAITACSRLGKEYHPLEVALTDALRAYLADVPRIVEMTMMDDTPTANTETQMWLEKQIGMPVASSKPAGEAMTRPPVDDAMELARAGRTGEAVAVITRQLSEARSLRSRFLSKTRLAAVLVEAGQEPIAMPILEELLTQIDSYKLEEWEAGEMVAEPLALLYRCLCKLDGDASARQNLYLRICRLDPLQALNCPV